MNEMNLVSGGHYHEDPTPNLFGGGYQRSASDLLGPDAGWIQGGGGGGGGGGGSGGTTTFSEIVSHGSTGGSSYSGPVNTGRGTREERTETAFCNITGGAINGGNTLMTGGVIIVGAGAIGTPLVPDGEVAGAVVALIGGVSWLAGQLARVVHTGVTGHRCT